MNLPEGVDIFSTPTLTKIFAAITVITADTQTRKKLTQAIVRARKLKTVLLGVALWHVKRMKKILATRILTITVMENGKKGAL